MKFQLTASLDPVAVRERFSADGYVHVPGILPLESADRIHDCLMQDTHWNLVFNDRSRHIDMPVEQLRTLARDKADQLQHAIFAQARQGFQYCYHNYPICDAHAAGRNREHLLHRFYEFLNSEAFLGFARAATGLDDIAFADAQATRYLSGHFLTTHDDTSEGKNRRAAYVFNFTRDWRADWGGYLQLLDESGHVRCGLKPTFNALNILAVPQSHNVGFVAPFAGGMRLSITGWLRAGEPAG
jgi:Rps23 Pro-64 3,4-dihydroxylase Tpa1-like proline 4-hydroxylase